MKRDTKSVVDLGGGRVSGIPPNQLSDSQCADILNFDVRPKSLKRRNGHVPVFFADPATSRGAIISMAQPIQYPVTAIGVFDSGEMLVATAADFRTQDSSLPLLAPTPIPTFEPLTFQSKQWSLAPYNGVVFCGRKNTPLWRVTRYGAQIAGSPDPSLAMALSSVAGNITPGIYKYFQTFETVTGDTTGPSPIASITLAVNSKVTVACAEIPTKAQYVNRVIWRTLPNDSGIYWRVATLPISTISYDDNTPNGSLSSTSFLNTVLPLPIEAYSVCKWKERLWLHNRKAVYGSRVALFETMELRFEDFDVKAEGHEIRAIFPWNDWLVVGTTDQIKYLEYTGLSETGVQYTTRTLTDQHGTTSHHSMAAGGGRLFFLDFDGVYMSNQGAPVEKISDPFVQEILDTLTAAELEDASAYTDPDKQEYCLSVGNFVVPEYHLVSGANSDRSGMNPAKITLVYNWRRGTWTTRKFGVRLYNRRDSLSGPVTEIIEMDVAPRTFWRRGDGVLFAGFGSYSVQQLDVGNFDDGFNIKASATSKAFGYPGAETVLRKVQVDLDSDDTDATLDDGSMTLNVYQDGRPNPARTTTRTLAAVPRRGLRRFGLGPVNFGETLRCEEFQVKIDYSGARGIEINGIHLEVDIYGTRLRSE